MDNIYVYQILKFLIDMSGSYVSSYDLSSMVGISESTLFRNIESVESYIADLGMYLSRVRGKGYEIIGTSRQLTALRARLDRIDFYPIYTSDERKALIFLFLISEKDGTKLVSIGRDLRLSDSTISKCLNCIDSDFDGYNLHVERRQGYGTTIEGDELEIRAFALRYILQVINKDEFMQRIMKEDEEIEKTEEFGLSVTEHLFFLFNNISPLKQLKCAFDMIERYYNVEFSDNSFITILLYLEIAALRIGCNKGIEPVINEGIDSLGDVKEILLNVCITGIEPSISECVLFDKLINAFCVLKNKPENQYHALAEKIIEKYESVFIASADPRDVIIDIVAGDIAFYKCQMDMNFVFSIPIINSREYKSTDDKLFINFVSELLRKTLGFEPSDNYMSALIEIIEPSMIKKHKRVKVAITCASGIGTSIYLERDLKSIIKDLDCIHIVSIRHLSEEFIKENKIDLIISTVPISIDIVPCVCIALPLHKKYHIESIKEAINSIKKDMEKLKKDKNNNKTTKGNSLMLLANFLWTNKTFSIQCEASDWISAVKKATSLLQEKEIINENYFPGILRLTEEYGPYYVVAPGVAMPHARPEDGALKTGFSLVTLSKPVSFGNEENDPVDIILCLAARSAKELNEEVIIEAMTLFENERCLQLLRDAKNEEEFKEALLLISENMET